MINIVKYSDGKGLQAVTPDELLKWDYNCSEKLWVDIYNNSEKESYDLLKNTFEFHPLAIEDSLKYLQDNTIHHPKIDIFDEYVFIVFNGLKVQEKTFKYDLFSLSCFLGHNFLVTVHNEEGGNFLTSNIKLILNDSTFKKGPDFILNLIFDEIVDRYYPILDNLEDEIDRIEKLVFNEQPNNDTLQKILNLKKNLIKLRRISSYQKEVLYKLSRGDSDLITSEETMYYRNVYDHLVRVSDTAESYRDYAAGMLDSYLSIVNNKMNEVMKFLTIIATIILPLSFVTGLFGMNFDEIPFLHSKFGFYLSLLIMLTIAVFMIFWFRKKRWL